MSVGLMTDVQKQTVISCEIKEFMEGDGQFDGAEAGGEMAALAGRRLQNPLAELRAEVAEFVIGIVFEFLMAGKRWHVVSFYGNLKRGLFSWRFQAENE